MNQLEVKNLSTHFFGEEITKAVDGVSFNIKKEEIFGLVGESGSGKSVTSMSILNLLKKPGKIVNGEIFLDGVNLLELTQEEMRSYRGKKISMIFQDPMTALNPVMKIGKQIDEIFLTHTNLSKEEVKAKTIELLEKVKIPEAKDRYNSYPYELSGGLRQRVIIAIAIALEPQLIIADEPTTALDVTIQKEIIELLLELKKELSSSILFISHDLALVSKIADRIGVMFAGKIVEIGDAKELVKNPQHKYTKALLECLPQFAKKGERLFSIDKEFKESLR